MTITIQGPGGAVVQFPDGTPQDEIVSAMDAQFGASKASEPISATNVARSFAKGIPIVGGLLNKAEAATNAALAPYIDPMLPADYEKLPEGTFGERYQHALDIQNRKDIEYQKEHPIASTAGEITGGLASIGGALKAAPTVAPRLLGLTGKTLPSQIMQGAASGAALSAADAATRGGDMGTASEIGAITGAAAPVVGRAIGRGIEAVQGLRRPAAMPQNVADIAGVPVRQSLGQATGDTEAIAREQMALRGADNSQEAAVARRFFDEQKQEVERAAAAIGQRMSPAGEIVAANPQEAASIVSDALTERGLQQRATSNAAAQRLTADAETLRAGLSPTRSVVAATPMEAANIVGRSVGEASAQAKKASDAAYEALRAAPGSFHPASFNRISDEIRIAVTRPDSIPITPETTKFSNQALSNIEDMLGGLGQERDAAGRVMAREPITPKLVDDARKRLNAYYRLAKSSAQATGNLADVSAMRDIIGEFDNQVISRLKDGRFKGDARGALDAMENARSIYSDYRKTFTPQGTGDAVGQAVQKIVGKFPGQAATPEQIEGHLYGKNASHIWDRLVSMFGPNSAEIGAVKQGALARLVDRPGGLGPLPPEKAADNIRQFVNSTVAQEHFSSAERQALSGHADRLIASIPAELSSTDNIVARIANGEMNTTDLVSMINGTKGGSRVEGLINRIKREFGEDSREFSALRQGQWSFLATATGGPLDVGSRSMVKKIDEFLKNVPLSHSLYNSDQRALIKSYRDLMERITPPPGTVNYSNTASVLGKMFRGTLDGLFAAGGVSMAGPVGVAAGLAAHQGQKIIQDTVRASKAARSLYGTPQSAAAMNDLQQSLARLASFTARATTTQRASNQ